MFEAFLDELRSGGKVKVVSSRESHDVETIIVSPVITRENQVGVLLQDRISGKSWLIETNKETDKFMQELIDAINTAKETAIKLDNLLKEHSNGGSGGGDRNFADLTGGGQLRVSSVHHCKSSTNGKLISYGKEYRR